MDYEFEYDARIKQWFLYGYTSDGEYWETERLDAFSRQQAVNDAREYLESFTDEEFEEEISFLTT